MYIHIYIRTNRIDRERFTVTAMPGGKLKREIFHFAWKCVNVSGEKRAIQSRSMRKIVENLKYVEHFDATSQKYCGYKNPIAPPRKCEERKKNQRENPTIWLLRMF